MPTFTIDTENNITVFASLKDIEGKGEGTEIFSSAEELAALATKWPGVRWPRSRPEAGTPPWRVAEAAFGRRVA